jgi:hypothetical protein
MFDMIVFSSSQKFQKQTHKTKKLHKLELKNQKAIEKQSDPFESHVFKTFHRPYKNGATFSLLNSQKICKIFFLNARELREFNRKKTESEKDDESRVRRMMSL